MARVATTGRVKMRTIASVAKFDGTSSQIDLGTGGAIAAATATFSCTCYLKRDKATGLTAMVGDNNNAAQNHWNFQIQGPNRKLLSTIITTSGAKALIGVRNIPQGFWTHAALTYDGALITFYVNGVFDTSTTHTGTVLASTAGVLIGTGSAPVGGAYRFFGGSIAEVKYWDRALSATEIADLYFDNRNDTSIRTNLKGEWLLNSNVNDSSGFGNNGTATAITYDTLDVPLKERTASTGRTGVVNRTLIT